MPDEEEKRIPDPDSGTDASSDEVNNHLLGLELWAVLGSLSLAIFVMAIDTSIVATAIPKITVEFNSTKDIGWYGSAFFLTLCSVQPLGGKLYSSFSIKWTFLSFFALFELGSLLCAVATSSNMLIVGRAIAGAGGSGLSSGAFSIVAFLTPLEKRPIYIGLISSVFGMATILGPIIGGLFTERVSWRWCFYINLPVGAVVAIALVALFKPGTRPIEQEPVLLRIKKLDMIGGTIFIPSIVMVLLALQWGGNEYAWNSATIIGLFCGFGGLLLVFAAWQVRLGDDAMIPPHILRQRTVLFGSLTISLLFGGVFVVIYYLPLWFQVIQDASPIQSGVMSIPLFIPQIIGNLVSGVMVSKIGYYNPWIMLGTILLSVGAGLLSTFDVLTGRAAWIGYQVIIGLGSGLSMQLPIVAVQAVLPLAQVPIGISIATFSQFFGCTILIGTAQTLFSNRLVKEVEQNVPGVSPLALLNAGAAGVRNLVSSDDLPGVLAAYNAAIKDTFYLAAAAGAVAVFFSLGIEWKSVRAKTAAVDPEASGPGRVAQE